MAFLAYGQSVTLHLLFKVVVPPVAYLICPPLDRIYGAFEFAAALALS